MITIGAKIITLHNVIVSKKFSDYVIIFYITESVSNLFLGYEILCVVTKYTAGQLFLS